VPDQVVGALIMKLTAMAVMFTALTIVFYRWYLAESPSARGAWLRKRDSRPKSV